MPLMGEEVGALSALGGASGRSGHPRNVRWLAHAATGFPAYAGMTQEKRDIGEERPHRRLISPVESPMEFGN
jgi:hypothetical protein